MALPRQRFARIAETWVRALLLLYPRRFRQRFGVGMLEAFGDRLEECAALGVLPLAMLLARTTIDMVVAALREWLRPSIPRDVPSRSDNRTALTRGSPMDHLKLDLRFALRSLARRPGFTAIAVITLALGIGANTAIFSVVRGVLLRSLPYPEPDRLVMVWEPDLEDQASPAVWHTHGSMSEPGMDDVREIDAVRAIEGFQMRTVTLNRTGAPELMRAAWVTGGLLDVFGLRPALGRDLTSEDALVAESATRAVVIGYDLWQTEFGGRSDVIGTTIELSEQSFEVVGVAPAGFRFPIGGPFGPEGAQLWRARRREPVNASGRWRGLGSYAAIAQLAAGVSLERASAELEVLASRLRQEYPDYDKTLRFEPLKNYVVGDVRRPLWIVMGAVGVVLLIACANVANLLLVRASARRGEVAVRGALGASHGRLVTQVLVESFVLALGGALIGLAVAVGGVELLKRLGPDAFPRIDEITVDATVLAFSLAMTIFVALLFGLSPALRMARTSVIDHLRSDARSGEQPREGWSRGVLLTVEVAMSLVLLVGAGLLTRSLVKLYEVDLGFDGREVVRFQLVLPSARYDSTATLVSFFRTLEQRISALPSVEAVGSAAFPPLASPRYGRSDVSFDWQPDPEPADSFVVWLRPVTPGYFDAMRLPLLRGRAIEATDREGSLPVAVVNETFVRETLGSEDPIGKRFGVGEDPRWTVVGVVGDVRRSLKAEPEPAVYLPNAQLTSRSVFVHVRGYPGASNLLAAVREQVQALDPNLPLRNPETVTDAIRRDAAPIPFLLLLIALFAGLALLLVIVGLYGVVSYLVSRRTREIGIRLALGASRMNITRLVLHHAVWPALLGIAAGLLTSIAVTGVMRNLLFEVEPIDPLVLGAVSALLLAVAAAASMLPARRAMSVNPTEVLRSE